MSERRSQLEQNLHSVRQRISDAAQKAGRSSDEITLVAVTKYVDNAVTRDLFDLGCHDLGENRPQAFWPKAEALVELPVRWHFIGHLQRNKLRKTLPFVTLLHSVDSLRLLKSIDQLASEGTAPKRIDLLLEVNISGDEAKHGFRSEELTEALTSAAALEHIRIRGLMCMAGLGTDQEGARKDFATLRELRDRLQEAHAAFDLRELSMGMSSDFEVAIAEGATIVRIGSVLFDGIDGKLG